MKRRRPRKRESSPVALGGEVVQEPLPLPEVYYPNHYGTFFAFARLEGEAPRLCNCTLGAVESYQALREQEPRQEYADPVKMALLDGAFPRRLAEMSLERKTAPTEWLSFHEKLCHRCNGATPSLRWCHEMYGGTFTQRYGWYTHVAAYRLGVNPRSLNYLRDSCPQEIIQDIESWRRAAAEAQEIRQQLEGWLSAPVRPELKDQPTYWHNVSMEEGRELRRLERASEQARRRVTKRFENIAREEFGFRKVGEGWVSESLLAKIIGRLFPGEPILRHHRPEWLDGLELDVFLPDQRLGIEYQGQQHFQPVSAWGGEKALVALQERDHRKAVSCARNNVVLVVVDYTEPLTDSYILERLREKGVSPPDQSEG